MHQTHSLYEQLGGETMVARAVTLFYRRVVADARLRSFFEGMNMERQVSMQRAFLTTAFGGPNSYAPRDWARALTESLRKDVLGR